MSLKKIQVWTRQNKLKIHVTQCHWNCRSLMVTKEIPTKQTKYEKNNKLDVHVEVTRWRCCSPGDADCIVTLYNNAETLHQKCNELVSAVVVSMRRPSCRKKSISTTIDVKSYSGDRLLYFDFFLCSASVATHSARTHDSTVEVACSQRVGTSEVPHKEQPRANGTMVRPSGRLSSLRLNDADGRCLGWR